MQINLKLTEKKKYNYLLITYTWKIRMEEVRKIFLEATFSHLWKRFSKFCMKFLSSFYVIYVSLTGLGYFLFSFNQS